MSLPIGVSPGYYFVDYEITWVSPVGAMLANKTIRANTTVDYLCSPAACVNYGPYIYLY